MRYPSSKQKYYSQSSSTWSICKLNLIKRRLKMLFEFGLVFVIKNDIRINSTNSFKTYFPQKLDKFEEFKRELLVEIHEKEKEEKSFDQCSLYVIILELMLHKIRRKDKILLVVSCLLDLEHKGDETIQDQEYLAPYTGL